MSAETLAALLEAAEAARRAGDLDAAAGAYARAVKHDGGSAVAFAGLGEVFRAQGKPDQAASCFREAMRLEPTFAAAALNNLGTIAEGRGDLDGAIAHYRAALARDPAVAPSHANLGHALHMAGRLDEAEAAYGEALRLAPDFAAVHYNMGHLRRAQGRLEDAAASYRAAVTHDPSHDRARHQLASLTGAAADRAPADYVSRLFDDYAGHFDEALLDGLDYRVPALLETAIATARPEGGGWRVLDLGCGTGLMGPRFRPRAAWLEGCDLSAGMLAQAEARGGYDVLRQEDLDSSLARHGAPWDLIVAADVFCYLGDLEAVFAAVARRLARDGLFAFSVEDGPGAAPTLKPTGRFGHPLAYVATVASDSGLTALDRREEVLRQDGGQAIRGRIHLFTAP